MVEKSSTPEVAVPRFRTRAEKKRQAEYSARHRQKRADVPEMRVIDRTLVEALGRHLVTLPPEASAALLPVLVDLSVAGLVYAGYDRRAAKRAIGKRLQYWMTTIPRGTVKAAQDRASGGPADLTA